MRNVVVKCEQFLQNLRWKVIHFLNDSKSPPDSNTFGFKTPKNAPQPKQLTNFENDLSHLIANLEYHNNTNQFQQQLKKDVNIINKSKNVFVKADKTRNVYEIKPEGYNKLMRDNVTSNYKKEDTNMEKDINLEAKKITQKLNISDRV